MLIDDDNSDALDLPKTYGVDDIPLVIQDRLFDDAGAFRFVRTEGAVYGDTMLINGTWSPFLQVESRRIRFRLLNGSNARIYYIGFDDNRVFHQIATDGGFLETPLQTRPREPRSRRTRRDPGGLQRRRRGGVEELSGDRIPGIL